MRPSSLGGGRILRRTLSVCLSVCPSVPLSSVTWRHLANYNETHVLFGRGPHIVRPSRPHTFLLLCATVLDKMLNSLETILICELLCLSTLCVRAAQGQIFPHFCTSLQKILPDTAVCQSTIDIYMNGCVKELNISIYFNISIYRYRVFFSAHQSMVFYFRCSVYWWNGNV